MTRILQACSHCSHEGRPCGASRARVAVAQGRPLQPGAPSPAGSEATAPSPVRTWRWPAAPGRPSEKRAGEGARGRDADPAASGRSAYHISEGFPRWTRRLDRPGRRRSSGSQGRGRGRGDGRARAPWEPRPGSAAPARARDSETFLFGACLLRGCVGRRRDGRLGKVFLK